MAANGEAEDMEVEVQKKSKKQLRQEKKDTSAYLLKQMQHKMRKMGAREKIVLISGKQNGVWRRLPLCCDVCNRRFTSTACLKQHIVTLSHFKSGQSYKCDQCNKCFMSKNSRKQHMRSHADTDANADNNVNADANANPDANAGAENNNNNNKNNSASPSAPIPTKGMRDAAAKGKAPVWNATEEERKTNKMKEMLLQAEGLQILEKKARVEKELKQQEEAVIKMRQDLEEEKDKMKQLNETKEKRVTLNVGGKLFQTTVDTLRKCEGSMLSSMFSGRYSVKPEEFIDRDPTYFNLVLNYLRDGKVFIPKAKNERYGLEQEADYYGLTGLVELCREGDGGVGADKSARKTKSGKKTVGSDNEMDE